MATIATVAPLLMSASTPRPFTATSTPAAHIASDVSSRGSSTTKGAPINGAAAATSASPNTNVTGGPAGGTLGERTSDSSREARSDTSPGLTTGSDGPANSGSISHSVAEDAAGWRSRAVAAAADRDRNLEELQKERAKCEALQRQLAEFAAARLGGGGGGRVANAVSPTTVSAAATAEAGRAMGGGSALEGLNPASTSSAEMDAVDNSGAVMGAAVASKKESTAVAGTSPSGSGTSSASPDSSATEAATKGPVETAKGGKKPAKGKRRKQQTHTRTKAVDLAPYTTILRDAIMSLPGQQAYLCEIYAYLQENFACFKNAPDHRWKNSVRHNLSIHDEFQRVTPREGERRRTMTDAQSKGAAGFWTVVEVADDGRVGGNGGPGAPRRSGSEGGSTQPPRKRRRSSTKKSGRGSGSVADGSGSRKRRGSQKQTLEGAGAGIPGKPKVAAEENVSVANLLLSLANPKPESE